MSTSKGFREQQKIIAYLLLHPKRLAIIEACLIGIVSGLAGVFFRQGVGWLGTWRVTPPFALSSLLWFPIVGLIGGLLSGWLVEIFAPEASGGGIIQVKAVLANVPMPLNMRIALIKAVSSILALGSGFTLGSEAPIIQIGSALAAQLSRIFPTSPDYRRQLIAAGASAGLAAEFNTPMGGVIFVVEELLHDVSGLTLGPAIIASFIGAVISRILGGKNLNLALNLTIHNTSFSAHEIPCYIILGVLAGLLGGLFNQGILASFALNKRLGLTTSIRVGLAGLISGLVLAMLPEVFRDNAGLREFLINGEANWTITSIAFIVHFVLTLVAAGSGAPGGLLTPSLILGSALGYLVGFAQVNLLGIGWPTTYALVGMGAFFTAVSRAPITAIVMVFEITTNFNLVLPLMIVSIVAYLVAEKVHSGSLYDHLLELNGINLKKEKIANDILIELTANDVMQSRVETLSSSLSIQEVIQAFSRSHHRGFPIVNDDQLVGIVTQTDLANAEKLHLLPDTPVSQIMTPHPVTVNSTDTLSQVLYLLNRYKLSRLPVTDGKKLVGIITRTDIIRAQSDRLTGEIGQVGPHPEPSYCVYQTRAASVGQGRLLVPLSNSQTAPVLLRLAAAIARDRNYELECLQIISIPRHNSPTLTPVRTTTSRRLLQQGERVGKEWDIPVHTQIRVAHDRAQAILETIKDRHIDLILMGWSGTTPTPGRIFGNIVDTIIRQADCDVLLVKFSEKLINLDQHDYSQLGLNRWLVPIRGGPNVARTLELLPALIAISDTPEIRLCQVFERSNEHPDTTELDQATQLLQGQLSCPIFSLSVCSTSVPEAIIDMTQKDQCDVIVLGASREGLLQQVIKGNIPEAIARGVNSTIILVRGAIR